MKAKTEHTRSSGNVFADLELPDADERASITEAIRRDQELSLGGIGGRTHEEVIQAARRSLE